MRVRILTAIVVLVALILACAAWAQDEERVLLRYQWNAGEEIVWDITSETSGTMVMRDLTKDPVEETETPMWTRVLMPMTLLVESVDEEGNGTVVYEMGTMQMDVQVEGKQSYIVLDPKASTMTVDGEESPLPPGAGAGMAGYYRMVISPRGDVLEMELPEGLGAMGLTGGADMSQWMRMSQQWSVAFPEEPVGFDYVWGAAFDMPLVALGAVAGDEEQDGEHDHDGQGEHGEEGEHEAGDDAPSLIAGSTLYRMAGTRLVADVDCVTLDMLSAMDIETMPVPMAGAFGGTEGEGMELAIGPMHMSISGGFDFDPAGGRMVGADTRVVIDMIQRIKGTVQTPEGEQEMNMEMITRGMTIDSTIEVR